MLVTLFSEVLLVVKIDTIFSYIKLFLKGTLCGSDGLLTQHLLDVLCGEGHDVSRDLLCAITIVDNLWLEEDV